MREQINTLIDEINKKIQIARLIPESFDPRETPMGIDLDHFQEMECHWNINQLHDTPESYLAYFSDIDQTLVDYLDLFLFEIMGIIFLQYTNPKSVHKIMDHIGTKGVLNSDTGLNIFRDDFEAKFQKTEWLVIAREKLSKITNEEKQKYDNFLDKGLFYNLKAKK